MNTQLDSIIYSDVGSRILSYLNFENIIGLRLVSKNMLAGTISQDLTILLLEKGGIQNLYQTERICSLEKSLFDELVKKVFNSVVNKAVSIKLTEQTRSFTCLSTLNRLFPHIETLEVEVYLENLEINSLLEPLKALKTATIIFQNNQSLCSKITHHKTLETFTIQASGIRNPPSFYECPKLREINIEKCVVIEPPMIRNCPQAMDINYRVVPQNQQCSHAMDY